ncbi:flagellar protein [Methylobacterium sp. WL119]|uniref:flagellin N-terminal helical domain-containing protein n=2 Tax=Methylobacterium TaxID=407 RepID=UPI0011C9F92C|nr:MULTISPECIES: flagellin [unclassified Methylobacterium]TXN39019.1 flagellar protein [Methylobacterium sp. WL93]TXN50192.1 flagellar protein [Methylobacterium sp. WL119]
MSGVSLTAATRQNLLSLQDTASLSSTTQNRLSTGKKVSSALDNPVNFFTAQSLSNRSSDLGTLLDSISNGVQTIQAANQGLTSIQKLVDSAKSTANQALATQITTTGTAAAAFSAAAGSVNLEVNGTAVSTTLTASDTIDTTIAKLNTAVSAQGAGNAFSKDVTGTKIVVNGTADIEFSSPADQTALGFTSGAANAGPQYGTTSTAGQSSNLTVTGVKERAALAKQYNSLLTQIDQLAKDSSFNGTNLLSSSAASNKLHISFNEKDTSNLDVQGVDATSGGLSLTSITGNSGATADGKGNFLLDSTVTSTLTSLTNASSTLRSQASTFGSNLSVVQNRQDFTKNLQNVLDTGASKLTDADLNEEAANSQALSTRQSLGISALSLANQAQQGVLQLLR